MILTCPACGTKYVVKDGAIPPGGRQVRCAACKHSWHQDPEIAAAEQAGEYAATVDAPLAEAPTEALPPAEVTETQVEAGPDDLDVAAAPPEQVGDSEPAAPPERDQWTPAPGSEFREIEQQQEAAAEDFGPFAYEEPEERPRRRVPWLAWLLLLVAAAAAAAWFLFPAELRQRLGLVAIDETPLEVMVTNSDRTRLESGNEFLNIRGRVINPTDEEQRVPTIHAQLQDASGKVVYSWTIAPPAPTLAPGKSATFNSAEVGIPKGGSHLTLTLGEPAA